MQHFWLTVFLALVVFIGRLPATIRRIKAQREALRPVQPISRSDHLPCIVNTIGAAVTEFFMLGLMVLAVFIASNAAFGTMGQAPDTSTGLRHISLGVVAIIIALMMIIGLLLVGGAFARYGLMFITALGILAWMVLTSAGEDGPAVLLFACLAVAGPVLLIKLLRTLF